MVRDEFKDADEIIVADGCGSDILCTDEYTIYDGIEHEEGTDGHLAITRSDTYVIGDAHVNTRETRYNCLHQRLTKFRSVSKHHLQNCVIPFR